MLISRLPQADCWILDFDGTIVTRDVGDELCERFADAAWLTIDQAWERGEVSLPDAQRQMWAMVNATGDQLLAYAREVSVIRAGFDQLIERAAQEGVTLVLASGGFDFYIEAILGERLSAFEACYYNVGRPNGVSVDVHFPHAEGVGCALCAVCKGQICRQYKERYGAVLFVGDGTSDRCAVGVADGIGAVKGSKLAGYCAEAGVDAVEFVDFHELRLAMGG